MTNTWVTFCCPSYSKKYFLTMLRILGISLYICKMKLTSFVVMKEN